MKAAFFPRLENVREILFSIFCLSVKCVRFDKSVFFLCLKSQGGDKLTLSLNKMNKPSDSASVATKLVNLPSSSPQINNGGEAKENGSGETDQPNSSISVTHFSPSITGEGLERETLFSNSGNPFLQNGDDDQGTEQTGGGNPFLNENGKFATIARSNPFTSTSSSNPFLENNREEKDRNDDDDKRKEEVPPLPKVKIVSTNECILFPSLRLSIGVNRFIVDITEFYGDVFSGDFFRLNGARNAFPFRRREDDIDGLELENQ